MTSKFNTKTARYLIVLNVLVLIGFGVKYSTAMIQQRRLEQRQITAAASGIAAAGAMSLPESTKLFEISSELEHGGALSDIDFEWCLTQLHRDDGSIDQGQLRRSMVRLVLSKGVKKLDAPQKKILYEDMVRKINDESPTDDEGSDLAGSAFLLGTIGDKRAIAVIERYVNDPRPIVRRAIQEALNRLAGTAS